MTPERKAVLRKSYETEIEIYETWVGEAPFFARQAAISARFSIEILDALDAAEKRQEVRDQQIISATWEIARGCVAFDPDFGPYFDGDTPTLAQINVAIERLGLERENP